MTANNLNLTDPNWQSVAKLADQCVLCGLCLPHCPTYSVHRKESESPRGRISLALALARGQLSDPQSALAPLQHCLGCLSCEGVCPAGVRYGDLITQTRTLLPVQGSAWARAVRRWVAKPWMIALGMRAYRAWSMLDRPRWFLPCALAALAKGVPPAVPASRAVQAGKQSRRWLFSGCAGSAIDQPARVAAAELLATLGLSVNAHPFSGCCGQLHRIAGEAAKAQGLADQLQKRLDTAEVEQLISLGSGCYAQLIRAAGPSRVIDLAQLLLDPAFRDRMAFRPLPLVVHLHHPCSQRSDVKDTQSWQRLLERIPELVVKPMRNGPSCCGAAGTHCLDQPQTAAALRQALLATLEPTVQWVLTTNPGCAMYLRAGVVDAGQPVRIAHPIELLAEQLRSDFPATVDVAN